MGVAPGTSSAVMSRYEADPAEPLVARPYRRRDIARLHRRRFGPQPQALRRAVAGAYAGEHPYTEWRTMMTATLSSPSTPTTRPHKVRDVRRFQRIVAAVILPIPATAVAIGRLFGTDDSDTRRALDLIAADPSRQFTFALLGFIAMLTVVPAFLAAARLAKRRRPVLNMIALGVNLIAYLGGFALAALDSMYLAASKLPVEQGWSCGTH
jgi:hypothetical protein